MASHLRLASLVAACLLGIGGLALAQLAPSGPGGPSPAPGSTPKPGPGPGSAPQDASAYFRYSVCNKSSRDVFITVSNRVKPGSDTWRNHGWYTVARGQCLDIGTFPKGIFYWYGRDRQGEQWGGQGEFDDERSCVDFNAAFDFTYSDGAGSCPAGFAEVRFKRLVVDTSAWTSTLND